MYVQPYLFFEGRTEEALDFYKRALGAEVTTLMRFRDAPKCDDGGESKMPPPEQGDKVMHSSFRVGDTTIMASDGRCSGQSAMQGMALALSPSSVEETERYFKALSDGGQVQMPLTETFFSQRFGMVADKFGVAWMVVAPMAESAQKQKVA